MARIDDLAKDGRYDEALRALDSSCDSALLAQKQLEADRAVKGTQFTCLTRTKVQILTPGTTRASA